MVLIEHIELTIPMYTSATSTESLQRQRKDCTAIEKVCNHD